jgi:hypothetical protein
MSVDALSVGVRQILSLRKPYKDCYETTASLANVLYELISTTHCIHQHQSQLVTVGANRMLFDANCLAIAVKGTISMRCKSSSLLVPTAASSNDTVCV